MGACTTRRRYSDEEILESLRRHPDLSASQWLKQKLAPTCWTIRNRFGSWDRARETAGLEPRKCVMCGNVLETRGKYCPKCRPLRVRELMREFRRKYEQEQRLALALSDIDRISSRLGLPKDVRKTAAAIYERVARDPIHGRPIECLAAAALYAACRERKLPLTLGDIAGATRTTKKRIARNYKFIARELLLRLRPVDPVDYVPRICSKLKLGEATQAKAIQLLEEATEKGLTSGRGPTGVAAAAIYIASVLTGEKRNQREVAGAAGVTDVTLRNRCREMIERTVLDLEEKP